MAVSVGTTFLAFSFLFANTAQKVFASFTFVFLRSYIPWYSWLNAIALTCVCIYRYPFDVGDRVSLGLNGEPM